MGLPNWLHWTAWFVKSLAFILITIILITALLKVKTPSSSYTINRIINMTILCNRVNCSDLLFRLLFIQGSLVRWFDTGSAGEIGWHSILLFHAHLRHHKHLVLLPHDCILL
jgi:hypothetical protein